MTSNRDPSPLLHSGSTALLPAPAAKASFDAVIDASDASDAFAKVGAMNQRIDSIALSHPTVTG